MEIQVSYRIIKILLQLANKLKLNWLQPSWVRYGFYLVLSAGLLTFLIIDTADERVRLQSFGGLLIFLLLGWIFSKYPSRVRNTLVSQFSVTYFHQLVRYATFLCTGDLETRSMGHYVTIDFWSNRLTMGLWPKNIRMFRKKIFSSSGLLSCWIRVRLWLSGQRSKRFRNSVGNHICFQSRPKFRCYTFIIIPFRTIPTFYFWQILSVIYFFSFLINLLYYYGAMQWTVEKLGWLLQISVGTTAAESMNAAANIFLGQVFNQTQKMSFCFLNLLLLFPPNDRRKLHFWLNLFFPRWRNQKFTPFSRLDSQL